MESFRECWFDSGNFAKVVVLGSLDCWVADGLDYILYFRWFCIMWESRIQEYVDMVSNVLAALHSNIDISEQFIPNKF